MANTYDWTTGAVTQGQAAVQQNLIREEFKIYRKTIDFSVQNLDSSESDVAQCISLPIGTTVLDCFLRVITAETTDAIVNLGYGTDASYWGKSLNVDATGSVSTILKGSDTWDPASIDDPGSAAAIVESKDFTVAGATSGDAAYAYSSIDLTDAIVTAAVTAEDTVTVSIVNPTANALNLGSMTMYVVVNKAPSRGVPLYFAAVDTIDITSSILNGDENLDALKVEVVAICINHAV